jgi:hypothetical protein
MANDELDFKKGDCITKANVIEKYLLEGKDAFKKSIESIDHLLDKFEKERTLYPE